MADQPLINPNWLIDPADVAVAIAGYKRVRQLFATKALAPVLIGPEYFPGPSVQTDAEIYYSSVRVSTPCFMPRLLVRWERRAIPRL